MTAPLPTPALILAADHRARAVLTTENWSEFFGALAHALPSCDGILATAQPLSGLAAAGHLTALHRTYLSINRTGLAGSAFELDDRLVASVPRAAVDGYAPGDAGQEGAFVVEVLPSGVAIELQEDLLHCVFGVVGVEQDGIGHAKDEARLTLDQRRELRLSVRGQGLSAPLVLLPANAHPPQGGAASSNPCTPAKTAERGVVFGYFVDQKKNGPLLV